MTDANATVTDPTGEQLDALIDAAADGIDFDGLRVERTDRGYAFETPTTDRRDLGENSLRSVAREHPEHVTNWYVWERAVGGAGTARRAYLRWLERADERTVSDRYEALGTGVTRTWGQLAILASVREDGERVYEVRHEADLGTPTRDLFRLTDPLDARSLVTYDERERYRPLKTAPTLRTGWAIMDLDGAKLVRTVDVVYPATIANWHRERTGDLDVSHYRETAARQTGFYDVVDELSVDELEHAVWACCTDDVCLKRRAWDEDDETSLSVDRGDAAFPCREPCSVFLTAARTFVSLGRAERRTYEVDLTPTEKEHLDDILAAVSAGRLDEISEPDVTDSANRYRVRYLAAQLSSDCGPPDASTQPEGNG